MMTAALVGLGGMVGALLRFRSPLLSLLGLGLSVGHPLVELVARLPPDQRAKHINRLDRLGLLNPV